MSNQTWFDAFFNAVTRSPEFKTVVTKDWSWDMIKSLQDMEEKLWKVSNIAMWQVSEIKNNFATKEAIETWNSLTTKDIDDLKKMSNNIEETKEQKEENKLEVEYFTIKNPETFWFKWIAWMNGLKESLMESFVKPLRFKFMVERLKKDENLAKLNEQTSPQSPSIEGKIRNEQGEFVFKSNNHKEEDEKLKIYKALYEAYEKFKVNIPTWLMFYGPPWTWKTFITKKLAEELWAWLIKKSVWEFGSSYLHQTSKNIKDFFEQAKKESEKWPIILFLDEIDSLVSTRSEKSDWNKAEEISQFLQEFNNLATAQNLIVVAATNRPDHLDSAILRTGRFDKKFYIWPPDFEARKELFEIYIKKEDRPSEKLDYEKLANLTEGYVPADIEWICDEVARDASESILDIANSLEDWKFDSKEILANLEKNKITMELLEKAILEMPSSLKMVDMSIYEKWAEKVA